MSIDRPDSHTLVFGCDACDEVVEFAAQDEGVDDPPNFVTSWQAAKDQGWRTDKHVGFDWEHYCPECAKLSDKDRIPRARE